MLKLIPDRQLPSTVNFSTIDSLKENSPTILCIWWQRLIKESQSHLRRFFHFFKNFGWGRVLSLSPPFWICHYLPGVLGEFFPTSSTGDVTPDIAEDNWERGWKFLSSPNKLKNKSKKSRWSRDISTNSALTSSNSRIKPKTYRLCVPNLVPTKATLGHSWASRILYFALRRTNQPPTPLLLRKIICKQSKSETNLTSS